MGAVQMTYVPCVCKQTNMYICYQSLTEIYLKVFGHVHVLVCI